MLLRDHVLNVVIAEKNTAPDLNKFAWQTISEFINVCWLYPFFLNYFSLVIK